MNKQSILGYQPQDSFINRLNATAKLFFFLLVSIACMTTFDTRFLLFVALFSLILFKSAHLKWQQVSFIIKFIALFSLLNLIAIFIFQPTYGQELYGSRHILLAAGYFTLTSQELFYLVNVALKYFCTVPLALLFLLTTDPSAFASSLNKLKISYKISYAVALALRYIPDIQATYWDISAAQQARGYELSSKAKLSTRLKGAINIILPLIFSSLERINTISTAMQLRRFGSKKKRTWYTQRPFKASDWLVVILAIVLFGITLYLFKLNHGRFYDPFN